MPEASEVYRNQAKKRVRPPVGVVYFLLTFFYYSEPGRQTGYKKSNKNELSTLQFLKSPKFTNGIPRNNFRSFQLSLYVANGFSPHLDFV